MDLSNIAVTQGHAPSSYNVGTYYSASLDLAQHLSVAVLLNCGVAQSTATVALELQESDDDSTFTDISGNDTLISASEALGTDEALYFGSQVRGVTKRYVRIKATVSNDRVEFSSSLISMPKDSRSRVTPVFSR
jgi:putative ubiquitin-RnfH superfamily antitoxin RatB of RatAB toxin-antitoxin module